MKLLIISPTPHGKDSNGMIRGHGATIKEINYLSTLFTEIVHLAPLYEDRNIESYLPYDSDRIEFIPLKPAGGHRVQDKVKIFARAPEWIDTIKKYLNAQRYDLIHLRTPSILSLITLLYFKTHKIDTLKWIKFAGNWEKNNTESKATKIQKSILRGKLHNAFITVNYVRNLPNERFIPFPNPSFYLSEYNENSEFVKHRDLCEPLNFAFVGNLYRTKGIMEALKVILKLKLKGINVTFHIVGKGPQKPIVEEFIHTHELHSTVYLHGAVPHKDVFKILKSSHFLLFPTYFNEGWPKVLSEAMSVGTIPITGEVSIIPDIIKACKCGVSLNPFDIDSYVQTIISYIENPEEWKRASLNAYKYAVFFTYEYYGLKLQQVLSKFLGKNGINEEHFKNIKECIRDLPFII